VLRGQRRLDNPDDFVRLEIATALKRDIRVIPVLVYGALMPQSRDLPDDLKTLVQRQALLLSHDCFRPDSERLVIAVKRVLEKRAAERLEHEPSAAVTPIPPLITAPTVEEKARSSLKRATKDHPWVTA
jgi:hypothetical protein